MNAPARVAPLSSVPAESSFAEDPALPHRFTWAEVRAMTAADVFGPDRRAELLRGEIFIMPQEGFLHVDCVRALQRWLLSTVSQLGLEICIREPLYLPGGSVLIPDLCVMPAGTEARSMQAERAALVIEVMDSTEARDRKLKLPAYAEAGVQEVWLVEAQARAVTAHRAALDGVWTSVQRYLPGQTFAPLCAPDAVFEPAGLPESVE